MKDNSIWNRSYYESLIALLWSRLRETKGREKSLIDAWITLGDGMEATYYFYKKYDWDTTEIEQAIKIYNKLGDQLESWLHEHNP